MLAGGHLPLKILQRGDGGLHDDNVTPSSPPEKAKETACMCITALSHHLTFTEETKPGSGLR